MNAVANILQGQGKRKAAIKVAEETFGKALKHEFTPIILSLATMLRRHYGIIVGDRKKMLQYHAIHEEYNQILRLEEAAEFFFVDLRSNFPKSKKGTEHLIVTAQQYVDELRPHLGQINSYRFHLLSYHVILALEQIKGNAKHVIKACEEAIEYFQDRPKAPKSTLFTFYYHQIPSLIQVGEEQKLAEVLKACSTLTTKGQHNWLITQQYRIIALFYQKDFESGLQAIQTTKTNAKKHESIYEMWVILEAYAAFLTGQKFRLQKFLNEVPTYEKDKRGMNINILIIQILYSLQRKKYEQIVEKVEAIRSYSYKYLREDDTYRSNCFIRMLLTLKPCGFKRSMVEKRAYELLEKMSAAPIRDIDVEPVSYEVLWGKVLELLK